MTWDVYVLDVNAPYGLGRCLMLNATETEVFMVVAEAIMENPGMRFVLRVSK